MKITILGSGSFFVDKNHSAPGYLLKIGRSNILLDCGPGTLNQLAKINFDPLKIDYIFITHFHNDHTSDLIALLFRPYITEKYYGGKFDKTLKIVGPKGIKDFTAKLSNAYCHGSLSNYERFEFIEYKPKIHFEDFDIKSFSVEHLGLDAKALRFESGGKVLAYTGDATFCDGVIKASTNADLLIADTATPKKHEPVAHMSTVNVGKICRDRRVKKVVLTHQVPPGYDVDMVSEVKEIFDGDIVLAKDLMTLRV